MRSSAASVLVCLAALAISNHLVGAISDGDKYTGRGAGAARTLTAVDNCADPCYTWNEGITPLGPNRCKTSCECDGARTCSKSGFCEGTARATGCVCFQPCYNWDEAKSSLGPNKCKTSCDCDGARTCSNFGFCQGTSRTSCACMVPGWNWNEGPAKNRCKNSCDCDGARTCSNWGYCQGTSRP